MSIVDEQPPGGDMTATIDQKEKRLMTIDFLSAGPFGLCCRLIHDSWRTGGGGV